MPTEQFEQCRLVTSAARFWSVKQHSHLISEERMWHFKYFRTQTNTSPRQTRDTQEYATHRLAQPPFTGRI